MELDWIETFLAVVDRGGFTAASSQVHRSQSRVSAHIAALERELGVQLIDRTRRPATLTESGRIFAQHARDILATVGSARSAIGVLRAMNEESLAVLTTPCIGASMFPAIIAQVLDRHPRARVALSEHGWLDSERVGTDDGFVLAVLPTIRHPHPPGLREKVLWREPIRAVLPAGHPLVDRAAGGSPLPVEKILRYPLVVGGASTAGQSELIEVMTARGLEPAPRAVVDSADTLIAMVRGGVGVGLLNAVAVENADITGLVAVDIDDDELIREVALYWFDVVGITEVGRSLQDAVLQSPVPKGAVALGAGRSAGLAPAPSSGADSIGGRGRRR